MREKTGTGIQVTFLIFGWSSSYIHFNGAASISHNMFLVMHYTVYILQAYFSLRLHNKGTLTTRDIIGLEFHVSLHLFPEYPHVNQYKAISTLYTHNLQVRLLLSAICKYVYNFPTKFPSTKKHSIFINKPYRLEGFSSNS